MTAPDPGLTDLIAADLKSHTWGHEYENAAHEDHTFDGGCKVCRGDVDAIAARALLAVEQHTNGRMASDLGADPQDYEIAWAAKLRWQARAEKAEAMIVRVENALPEASTGFNPTLGEYDKGWERGQQSVAQYVRSAIAGDGPAALEGEQQ